MSLTLFVNMCWNWKGCSTIIGQGHVDWVVFGPCDAAKQYLRKGTCTRVFIFDLTKKQTTVCYCKWHLKCIVVLIEESDEHECHGGGLCTSNNNTCRT